MTGRFDAIVVGAGIAGLAAAALLARRGLAVLVAEAHDRPGGFCTSWTREIHHNGRSLTYVFDGGVQDISGLGPKGPLRRLLTELGALDRIHWRRIRHAYVHHGLRLDVPEDYDGFRRALTELFPAEEAGIARFLAEIAAVYDDMYAEVDATGGVPMPPKSMAELLSWPQRHPHGWRWMKRPFSEMLDAFLVDPRLKAFLTTLSDYVTDQPELLKVADMAPLYGYYRYGGRYPAGGSQSLADTLSRAVVENGGRVLLRTPVARILVEEGKAAGIATADGTQYAAPLVLCNADAPRAMLELIDPSELPNSYAARLRALPRGPTAILLSLGLDHVPNLPPRVILRRDGLKFGIGNPSAIDPSLAPPGHAAVTMLCLLPESEGPRWRRGESDYAARKQGFAERLIATAESVAPGLSRSIRYCQVASPATFARYAGTADGAIYGARLGGWRPAMETPISGLLLVGAGGNFGAGIEAVVISGMAAANRITGDSQ